jgi:hypothetical protein
MRIKGRELRQIIREELLRETTQLEDADEAKSDTSIDPRGSSLDKDEKIIFFSFLQDLIDNADEYVNPNPADYMGGFGSRGNKVPTKEQTLARILNFRTFESQQFNNLVEKHGQKIVEALWKELEAMAEILEDRKKPARYDDEAAVTAKYAAERKYEDLKYQINQYRMGKKQ